jgi:hypothetical protein
MDILTHVLLTRTWVGKQPRVLMAGVASDAPFYLTYPAWVVSRGKAVHAFTTNQWPAAPRWSLTWHRAFHSLPVAIAGAAVMRVLTGRWPRQELAAWVLHIAIDIPTHARDPWAPRFLWPLSSAAVDGVPWAQIGSCAVRWLVERT